MGTSFDPSLFKRVAVSDRAVLEPLLLAASPTTCESNFPNMFIWGGVYLTKWQLFNGRVYAHLEGDDELLFPLGGEGLPSPEELRMVSDAMRKASFNGVFRQVPQKYVDAFPGLGCLFSAEQVPEEVGEYVYRVERLASLPGSKLAKKRNLIAQFKRENPEFRSEALRSSMLQECLSLVSSWREEKTELPAELEHERLAMKDAFDNFDALGLEGVAALVGGRLVAFSVFSRVSSELYTEHFEKAVPELKGAAQYVNQESAKALLSKCEWLDREQDLGLPGLRQAKRSYDPAYLLRNYNLAPK